MPNPIVIAYHIIFTAYGWWLPNDPRGSNSRSITTDIIADLGALHLGRKKIQPASRVIREFYERAAEVLKHELRTFTLEEARAIAAAFADAIEELGYTCWACVVMPDHIHLLIRKHKHTAEQMIEEIQLRSRKRLIVDGLRPADHPVWGGPGWKLFLDHPDDVWRTIKYIKDNPLKIRMPVQEYSFVKPYDNWPLHEGHSSNSPYVKRLRAVGRYP